MKITGNQLFFLMQVLKDSLEIQMGYDWNFTQKREERKKFHEELLKSLLLNEKVNVLK